MDTSLPTRALSRDDREALLTLSQATDRAWWGAEETDPEEIEQYLDRAGDLDEGTLGVTARDGRLEAAAFRLSDGSGHLLIDPTVADEDRQAIEDLLIGWLLDRGADSFEALAEDTGRDAAYRRHGIRRTTSSFELERPASRAGEPGPAWPDGIEVVPFDHAAHARPVHDLLYAFWAETPTHHERTFEEWSQLLLGPAGSDVHSHVVAWRDGRPVGAAICRTFTGDFGWISQLGVAPGERHRGLGRALLAEACDRLSAMPGITMIGLAVAAENRGALELYRSVGFSITREWVIYTAPRAEA